MTHEAADGSCPGAEPEISLGGGRLTAGVVKVGATVRRPFSASSSFTARLLDHLHDQGCDAAPRYLGTDEHGRDILTFIPGHVPAKWQRFTDRQIAAAAGLLRRLHDASRGLAATLGGEVVCHHDPGPNNTVFRNDKPIAFIDFDFAAAGDPLDDVGYLAWSWCISSKPSRGPATEQARQVRVLADAYGLAAGQRHRLIDAVATQLDRNADFWQPTPTGRPLAATAERTATMLAWTRREAAFVQTHRPAFDAALGDPPR